MDVAAVPKSFALGRVRGRNLRIGIAGVLVYGNDSRFGDLSGSEQVTVATHDLWDLVSWLDGFGQALVALREGLYVAGSLCSPSRFVCTHRS